MSIPGDDFRDGVLHLDARIDLDEIKLLAIQIEQKFDRSRVAIVRPPGTEPDGGIADLAGAAPRQIDARRDLHHFLMPPLHGAIALPEMDEIAVIDRQGSALRYAWPGGYTAR